MSGYKDTNTYQHHIQILFSSNRHLFDSQVRRILLQDHRMPLRRKQFSGCYTLGILGQQALKPREVRRALFQA